MKKRILMAKIAFTIVMIAAGANPHKALSHILPDCEDTMSVPCYTYDEGHWRVVYSYNPYRYKNVK